MSGKKITVTIWRDDKDFIRETVGTPTIAMQCWTKLGTRTIELDAPAEDARPKVREFWVVDPEQIEGLGGGLLRIKAWTSPIVDKSAPEQIHFVECPKGHRMVSEEQAKKLWKEIKGYIPPYVCFGYSHFARDLGFGGSDE